MLRIGDRAEYIGHISTAIQPIQGKHESVSGERIVRFVSGRLAQEHRVYHNCVDFINTGTCVFQGYEFTKVLAPNCMQGKYREIDNRRGVFDDNQGIILLIPS